MKNADAPSERLRLRPNKRKRWWMAALLLLLIGVGIGGWVWHRATVAASALTASAADVVAAEKGSVEKGIDSSGKVVSNLDVDIKCRASGEVIKLPFDISQSVKKGDLLCQLDPTDEMLAVRSADAAVAQAKAQVAQAQDDLEQAEQALDTTRRKDESDLASAKVKAANLRAKANREKQLLDQHFGSQEDMETAETDAAAAEGAYQEAQIAIDELKQQAIQVEYKRESVKTAEAQLASQQVMLETQKQQLAYTTVNSPIDGVVSALNIQKGAIVASGMSGFSGGTTILTLSDLSHVFVMATVDESDVGAVQVGQNARITVASFPDRTFTGTVTRIATKGVNSSNVVTFEVKVEVLDPHKDLLRPEMTGNVRIIQSSKPDVVTLPSSAVTHDDGKAYVTLPSGERREVTTGLDNSEVVEIVSGIKPGDRVLLTATELPTRWKSKETRGGPPPPP
jgi:multidrug efflux pump subunit AcrA (membrane-fusion protein)